MWKKKRFTFYENNKIILCVVLRSQCQHMTTETERSLLLHSKQPFHFFLLRICRAFIYALSESCDGGVLYLI
jgi:hypothetical protein